MKGKKIRLRLLPVILILGIWNGCANNDPDDYGPSAENAELNVTLRIPGANTPLSRTLSETQEHEVRTLDVLVFQDNGISETYLYRTHATDIDNNAGNYEKTYKVVFRTSEETLRYRLVFLANLRDEIERAESGFSTGQTKAEVLSMITFGSSRPWDTGPENYVPLPMYGETDKSYPLTGDTRIEPVSMLRSVVRIDIGFNVTDGGNGTQDALGFGNLFRMSDLKIYNTNKSGFAAPESGNMEKPGKVSLPTVPDNARNDQPLSYSFDFERYGLFRGIYLSEAANRNGDVSHEDALCVVIGGYYTRPGDVRNTTEKSWYRVDFYDRSSPVPANSRLDLLRNHKYLINITSVDGPGYASETEALNSAPVNMISDIVHWDECDIGYVVFNGQYMLGVSRTEFDLGMKENLHNTLHIETDYPGGWSYEIKKSADPDGDPMEPYRPDGNGGWLWCNGYSSEDLCFAVSKNEGRYARTGYIHIRAGRLTVVVKVVQTTSELLTLEISPEQEFIFPSGVIRGYVPAETLHLKWSPADLPLNLKCEPVGDKEMVSFKQVLPEQIADPAGEARLVLELERMRDDEVIGEDGYYREKAARLDFWLNNEDDMYVVRSVYIRQRHNGVYIDYNAKYDDHYFPMLGQVEDITILGNSEWDAELLEVPGFRPAIDRLLKTSGSGKDTDEVEFLEFIMNNGSSDDNSMGRSVIRLTNRSNEFLPVDVIVDGYYGLSFESPLGKRLAYPVDLPGGPHKRIELELRCAELGDGWYLPDMKDLRALRELLGTTPESREKYGFQARDYWSANQGTAGTGGNWGGYTFNFEDGSEAPRYASEEYAAEARCVRRR